MSNSQISRKGLAKNILALVAVLTLLFTYNNCGERGFQASDSDGSDVRKIDNELSAKYASKLNASTCQNAENYSCTHRIFSEDVEDYEVDMDFPCLEVNGTSLCVAGKQYGFNTGNAKLECGEDCKTNYEYEEVSCYLKFETEDKKMPVYGEASNFDEALLKANQSCNEFVGRLSAAK